MEAKIYISRYGRQLKGSQGAHEVFDQFETAWIIKPTNRERFGVKGSVTEYVAGRFAYELGLNVPHHAIAELPTELISLHSELNNFSGGPVLAVAYSNGMDLEHARRFPIVLGGLIGLSLFTNRKTAIGIIIADTWLANTDRGLGAAEAKLGPISNTSNEGNVYLKQVIGVDNTWDLQALDFGYAFFLSRWGRSVSEEWPEVLWGIMRFFFDVGLLTRELNDHKSEVEFWLTQLNSLDVESVLYEIVTELPIAWQKACSPNLVLDDFSDLLRRLQKTTTDMPLRLQEYDLAAAKYLS